MKLKRATWKESLGPNTNTNTLNLSQIISKPYINTPVYMHNGLFWFMFTPNQEHIGLRFKDLLFTKTKYKSNKKKKKGIKIIKRKK